MQVQKVKDELRQLRKINHYIQVLERVRESHEKRIELLKSTNSSSEDITRLESAIRALNIEDSIKRATAIEIKYFTIIDKLNIIDKAIILEGYVNGEPYWKVGQKIGYSANGIQKRIGIIINKIAKEIEKSEG